MNKKQSPSDGFLIQQYRSGNTSVLTSLVRRYHKTFCEKAYWITKDEEIAKDIAQESWITIINKLDTLKNVESFRSWALRIVYTKAIDGIKIKNKERTDIENLGLLEHGNDPVESKNKNIYLSLLKAIKALPKDKQDIIRLFYAEEYSINQISSFLNIPVGTVKSRLFKSREKLKSLIKKENHEK